MAHLERPFENTDDFYGEDDSAVKYKLRHFGKFKLLAILTCILAVLCVIFIVLFAVEKSKKTTSSIPNSSSSTICNKRECLLSSYGKFL